MDKKKVSFFTSADNVSIPYFEYHPKNNIKSAIVLIYEIFGATNHIHNFAKYLANKNYLVYIPDILTEQKKTVLEYNQNGLKRDYI